MSESMVERVARALHAHRYGEWYEGPLKMTDSQRACLADARDAIEAMREPTTGILTAFVDADVSIEDAKTRWNAAIDVALEGVAA